MLTGIAALKRAVQVIGTQSKTAEAIGIRQQSVSEIVSRGKRVPAEWVLPLEAATEAAGEKVTRHQLRPDLYPAPPKTDSRKRRPRSAPVEARA
jgi:DNA-binding transcriptional regulator YdaS (Cro superfamily)